MFRFGIPSRKTKKRPELFPPRTMYDYNWLSQSIVLSGSVETFKSIVFSIKY
jgi:hypothetical protein